MILFIVQFLVGLVLVVKGADWLTDGASAVARRFNVSTLLIGLTIVAFGTSLPELVVSTLSAMKGSSEMAMGNVIGSNMFNTLAIVGITALFFPIHCKPQLIRHEIPQNILITIIFTALVFYSSATPQLSRAAGCGLLAIFIIFLGYTIYSGLKDRKKDVAVSSDTTDDADDILQMPIWKSTIFILLGLAALIFGGDWFVDGASGIAAWMGVSESTIALTIVAAGTSFPELATSVMAARKGDTDMAMGNVVGSNIFNILLILGVSASVSPLSLGNIGVIDFVFVNASIILLTLLLLTNRRHCIGRWQGCILTLIMIAYYVYLVSAENA